MLELMRERYHGTLIVAGGFDQETAEAWLRQGKADLVAFGRKFLANPDLPERFRCGASLNADDPSTYYGGRIGLCENGCERGQDRVELRVDLVQSCKGLPEPPI
jgi:2,4-dienoyl-CoA reductase-like NADH-dependent reductase (Old Yellow Enzyme family)